MIKSKRKNIPIYPGRLFIIFFDNDQELKELLNITTETENYGGLTLSGGSHRGWLTYAIALRLPLAHSTIAHEVFHLAGRILHNSSVDASHDNDEAKAHLVGWLTDQVYKEVAKHRIKLQTKS